jgi:hypothetical protein
MGGAWCGLRIGRLIFGRAGLSVEYFYADDEMKGGVKQKNKGG